MTGTPEHDPKHDATADDPAESAEPVRDPTDTDHPTGEKQAAENAENEPAG